jgi:hypothetical protein
MRVKIPERDEYGNLLETKTTGILIACLKKGYPNYCVRFDSENVFAHNYYPGPEFCIFHTGEENKNLRIYYYYGIEDVEPFSQQLFLFEDD